MAYALKAVQPETTQARTAPPKTRAGQDGESVVAE